MRHLNTIFLLVLAFISTSIFSSFAQKGNNDEKMWSKVQVIQDKTREKLPHTNWTPASQVSTVYDFATVGPNIRPKPTTNSTQSEVSIDVHPTNKDIIFCSANATPYPVSGIYGTGVYWSLNGSSTWTGFDNPPFGSNSGDPASVIGLDGRFYENYISNSSGQGVSVSTNNGVTWTSYTVTPNPGSLADKNHYMVDKKAGSPYVNRSYCAWTDFGGANNNQAVLRYSTDFGATWSSIFNLSGSLSPGSHAQGVNIQTGPNGEVYVTYAIYDAWPGGEDAIGFSKSTNGGVTWTHARIYSAANFGIRGNLASKQNIRVSSFPSMAVDRSGGSYNGTIYITWPQIGVTPAGSDPDIVMIKSTNGGTNWTSPIRVNNDALNNGKDQYYPWCTVDQGTGRFMIVFYDSRNVVNSQAEVYMATSTDGGVTFENFKVSDQAHTPAPISGLASGYAGDYIGVAGLDNVAYPYWGDNRTGIYQGWTAKVTYGPPCPVNGATNPTPANNATNVSASLPQLSWTNGSGATQCEVWFGAGVMNMVYSGPLITSWTIPGTLSYSTNYSWQVIEKNDTCSVSGEAWNFTTELSPGLVFVEPFNNLNFWTAIGPLGTTNWSTQSAANAGGTAPELTLNWSPEFNGLSKLKSNAITVQTNRHYSIVLKHMLDWYANPAPNFGLGVSYDNGATYTPIWNFTPTGNVGPATVSATFITPTTDSPQSISLYFVIFCNGNSFNIDYWYLDDLSLNDDDYLAVNNPTGFTATPINDNQINLSFTPNANNNNVVIVWNQTGTFTTPTGTPPALGQPFAGGTLLSNGITSPVAHTGRTPSITYYYKAFSFASSTSTYSSGVQANAATTVSNPTGVAATPINGSQINVSFTPNTNNNNVVIVWNLTGIFTTPVGVPPALGQPFAGGTLLYNGTTSPVNHIGLNQLTTYYYKAFSYVATNYSQGVGASATTLSALDFGVSLLVYDNCSNSVPLTFGTAPGATDCFDPGLDVSAPPPPPLGAFDGAFQSCGETFFTDIRGSNPSGERIWDVYFSPATGCNPASLSWNPAQLTTTGYFHLVDPVYGNLVNVNMRESNSYTDLIGLGHLQIKYNYQICSNYNLTNGWNMLSLPLNVTNNNYLTLFPNAVPGTLFGYSGTYFSTETVVNSVGYWLKFPSSQIAQVYGLDKTECVVALNTGWNMIGGPNCNVPLSSVIDPGGIIIPGTLYGYSGSYFIANSIDGTKAYWIKANAPGTITISCGTAEAKRSNEVIISPETIADFDKVEISDASKNSQTIYFHGKLNDNINIESFSLPPVSPQGSFDARLTGDYKLSENEEVSIQVQASDYPLSVKITNRNSKEEYELVEIAGGVEVGSHRIADGKIIVITNKEVTMLKISKQQSIPTSFNLEQNYPNPFNPSTVIRFSIPEDAKNVRLKIYNSLGEEVAELVNSELQAGYYQYSWNAGNLSSGLYIYQIVTEKFAATKKMILLK